MELELIFDTHYLERKGSFYASTVKAKVIHNLSVVSGFAEDEISESQDLNLALGFSTEMRGALAPGFQTIARETKPDAIMSKSECKKLKKVKDCVDLVHKRS